MDVVVTKFLDPEKLIAALAHLKIPQHTLSILAEIQDSRLSMFIKGRRTLGLETQLRIFAALKFCQNVAHKSETPVDFRESESIRKLFNRQRAAQAESDAVGRASEFQLEVSE